MSRLFAGTDSVNADSAVLYALGNPYSVALWCKRSTVVGNEELFSETRSTSNNPFIQVEAPSAAPGKISITARGDGGGTSTINAVLTVASPIDGTWHHFIYCQDGAGNYKFYVDGALDRQGTYTVSACTINRGTMGAFRGTGGSSFTKGYKGQLAHVATFNRMLTAGEAALLGAGLLPSHIAPTHYWPLWGTDSTEPDIGVGTKVAGSFTGTPTFVSGGISSLRPLVVAR